MQQCWEQRLIDKHYFGEYQNVELFPSNFSCKRSYQLVLAAGSMYRK